jgi:ABC-2 type transport system permease protein
MFQSMARMRGMDVKELERRILSGPGRVMQSLIGGEQMRFDRAMDVLALGYIHPLMQVIFCLWAIGRAAGAVAGELDRGTMELLLAQPLPRSRVILAHFLVDLIVIPIVCLSLWGGLSLGVWLVGPLKVDPEAAQDIPLAADLDPKLAALAKASMPPPAPPDPERLKIDRLAFGLPLLNVGGLIFAISGITMWLSSAGRFRWRTVGYAALVMLAQFIFNVIGGMLDSLAFLRPLSVFYYYQPQHIALHHQWNASLAPLGLSGGVPVPLVLFGIGIAGYLLAWRTFARRDLPAPL